MTRIISRDEALQAIWNPKINMLLLNIGKGRPELLEDILFEIDDRFDLLRFPRSGYNLRLLTKIPEGFLSCPLLEVNDYRDRTVRSGTSANIIPRFLHHYELYGSALGYRYRTIYHIGKKRYNDFSLLERRYSRKGIPPTEHALGVSKTTELLTIQTQQDAQSYYLEHVLYSNLNTKIQQKHPGQLYGPNGSLPAFINQNFKRCTYPKYPR